MKRTSILIATVLLLTAASISAHAQAQPAASKIVIVNTAAFFEEKGGITRIVNASKQLSSELAPKRAEVQQIVTRLEALTKEIEVFRGNAAKGIPIDEKAAQSKVDELERLKIEGKYKEDDFNAFAQKKQNEIVGPAYADAMKALGEYIKSKAYGIVFDVSKDQGGTIIFAADQYDITKDFIAFFNAKPPTAINSVPK